MIIFLGEMKESHMRDFGTKMLFEMKITCNTDEETENQWSEDRITLQVSDRIRNKMHVF